MDTAVRIHVYVILILICLVPTSSWSGPQPIELEPSYDHDRWGTLPRDLVREFRAYTVSFDSADDNNGDGSSDAWAIPEWVAYEVKRFDGECIETHARPNWFTDDGLREEAIAPNDDSYRYSREFRRLNPDWYVRGHMQMKFLAARLGADAEWNTHTLLNAVPQRQEFNAGIWQELEALTGAWAQRYGAVWVITGPIVIDGTPSGYIGEEGELPVVIPDALFKIVIKEGGDPDQPEVLAFLYPQVGPGYSRDAPYPHHHYLVSVDEVETATGLDFLTTLPDVIESTIEKRRTEWLWPVDDGDFLYACR